MTTLVATGAAAAAAVTVGTTGQAHADTNVWDRVAQCESTGNWGINTGNGFSGGLQFTPSTWRAYGGSGSAQNASRSEQIRVAQRVLEGQGPGAWPVCSKRAGLTRANGGAASAGSDTQRASRSIERKVVKADRPVAKKTERKVERTHVAPKKAVRTHVAPKADRPVAKKADRKVVRTHVAPKHTVKRHHVHTAPAVKHSGQTITVKSGDTLAKLADKYDVSSWRQLWAANSKTVSNPNMIFVGQTLNLPA
ncbi:transglycosylase family protein [Luteipulveratus sp. YIM 133132]|uniref:transglycosylase family protein n=1 Tax=Luteipulveratus flavus TaxID=3031728 RepID=UPI0023B17F5E|nr:transglycosylase family protein [Luteipulveratus sp. YIM 133132]MDE9365557.1 transglycosylase family protein [Luteipulveratus sp. YIM 133132]